MVAWFNMAVPYLGSLVGHTFQTQPYVQWKQGETRVDSFDVIRKQSHDQVLAPNWANLPDMAKLLRPTSAERAMFSRLLEKRTPPGIKHQVLMREIYERGHEVFLGGGCVREVLTGGTPSEIEVVTTMPLLRLHQIVVSMYGRNAVYMGEIDQQQGQLKVGRGSERGSGHVVGVRLFRYSGALGSPDMVFGADFIRDVGYGDFSCAAIYYDPFNDVLIDPTGHGVDDVDARLLRPVFDHDCRRPEEKAEIVLRTVRLLLRGFELAPGSDDWFRLLAPELGALTFEDLAQLIRAEIAHGVDKAELATTWGHTRAKFEELGLADVFQECMCPHQEWLLP